MSLPWLLCVLTSLVVDDTFFILGVRVISLIAQLHCCRSECPLLVSYKLSVIEEYSLTYAPSFQTTTLYTN